MKTSKISRFVKLSPIGSLKTVTVSYSELIGSSVEYPETKVDKSFFETSATAVKRIKSLGGFDAPLPYDANPYALSAEVARMRSRGVDSSEIYQASIRAEKQLKQILSAASTTAVNPELENTSPVTPASSDNSSTSS